MTKKKKIKNARLRIYKKYIRLKLIHEFRCYPTKTLFFTTIAVSAGAFKHGRGMMYDKIIDFMEVKYSASEFDKLIDPDDEIIMRIAHDLYSAVRFVYVCNIQR